MVYTKSELLDKHLVHHIVHVALTMDPISEDNKLPPRGCPIKIASEKQAMTIRKDDDEFFMEEQIIRRETLEDPDNERFDKYIDLIN